MSNNYEMMPPDYRPTKVKRHSRVVLWVIVATALVLLVTV